MMFLPRRPGLESRIEGRAGKGEKEKRKEERLGEDLERRIG